MELKKIKLGINNAEGKPFVVSRFDDTSDFTNQMIEAFKGTKIDFYLISEIKGTLDIEGEGSSRKIIKDLVSGKREAANNNERKAINLYSVMDFIRKAKPKMNKQNLMIIYNMLKMNIDMGTDELEDSMDYRKTSDGMVKKFKTPIQSVMSKGMDDLFSFIDSDLMAKTKIEKAILIQIIFIYFHPFYDFNGRTGRLMSYWFLITHGAESVANAIYLALPSNKSKYIKMWDALRKFKWNDLTTFMNFIGHVTDLGVKKMSSIEMIAKHKGLSINDTEKLIMFYLLEESRWVPVSDLIVKIDLGISKQAIHNAVVSMTRKGLIYSKKSSNKTYVKTRIAGSGSAIEILNSFYLEWTKEMSRSDFIYKDIETIK